MLQRKEEIGDTKVFYEDLQKVVNRFNRTDHSLVTDLNDRTGN